ALSLDHLDLADIAAGIVEASKEDPAARDRHITVETSEPLWVHADRIRIEQVILNLVNNAIKFTAPGGHIRVTLKRAGREAVLEVKDDGRGIDTDFLPHVFDMFRQGRTGPNRSNSGLGIGLALARQIVELHNGVITAESGGNGRGACFCVRLPLSDAPRNTGDDADQGAGQALHGVEVLLVDDNAEAVDSFKYLLEFEGAKAHVTRTAQDALACLDKQRVDLIISDLAMPGMDGFALMEQVRARYGKKSPLAIAVSGLGRAQDEERALQAGFAAHLTKPVSIDMLMQTAAKLLGKG
ncbi:MAG TPA: hybrid sensor histidine kinase/response regulator, partial [Noviherbaspirillum sp.]|nr:hybrid sensor histidine kinase/response regulator [Noviherbaspirillum sp.]